MKMLKNKIVLITGGTGSFGSALLEKLLNTNIKEIRIFSRDEKKQEELRRKYKNEKLKFYIGDVRNEESIERAMKDVDYVFHTAALKQVPSCEYFPMEAIYTNAMGTANIIDSAIKNKVKKVVLLSTDKAVYAVSAMGYTKGLMEKIGLSKARELNNNTDTVICVTRFGNVMGTSGSVIPYFYSLIENNKPLTITEPSMTRFMMTMTDAIDLVLYAFEKAGQGDILVQKMSSVRIDTLAEAMKKEKGSNVEIKVIGKRPGEKEIETLLTKEEMEVAIDMGNYYKIPLDGKIINKNADAYTSVNTKQLNVNEMIELLKRS